MSDSDKPRQPKKYASVKKIDDSAQQNSSVKLTDLVKNNSAKNDSPLKETSNKIATTQLGSQTVGKASKTDAKSKLSESSVQHYSPNPSKGTSHPSLANETVNTVDTSSNPNQAKSQAKSIPIPEGMPSISQNHKQTQKAAKPVFELSFLHPKYWVIWIGFIFLYPLIFLPLRYQFWLGRRLGIMIYHLSQHRRAIALNNLQLAFPEKMDAERERLAKQVFVNLGIGIFETLCAWYRPDVFTRTVSISGLQHLVTAKKADRLIVLLGAHYTVYDLGLRLLTQFTAIDCVYPTSHNRLLDWFIDNGRRHIMNQKIEPNQINTLTDETVASDLSESTSSQVIWYAADQFNVDAQFDDNTQNPHQSVIAPFFGVPTATSTLPRQLSQLSGHCNDYNSDSDKTNPVAVMALHTYRQTPDNLPKGKRPHYHITITPTFEDYPSPHDVADSTRVNETLEGLIRVDPTQWMWFRKCYKTPSH